MQTFTHYTHCLGNISYFSWTLKSNIYAAVHFSKLASTG